MRKHRRQTLLNFVQPVLNMQKNLKEMPNNKGYLWRGVTFYGDMPEENNEEN